jgi:hypothetical protein
MLQIHFLGVAAGDGSVLRASHSRRSPEDSGETQPCRPADQFFGRPIALSAAVLRMEADRKMRFAVRPRA